MLEMMDAYAFILCHSTCCSPPSLGISDNSNMGPPRYALRVFVSDVAMARHPGWLLRSQRHHSAPRAANHSCRCEVWFGPSVWTAGVPRQGL